jgi:hypothetical protein
MSSSVISLDKGWMLKEDGEEHVKSWMKVARIPTNVHIDLLNNNKFVWQKG